MALADTFNIDRDEYVFKMASLHCAEAISNEMAFISQESESIISETNKIRERQDTLIGLLNRLDELSIKINTIEEAINTLSMMDDDASVVGVLEDIKMIGIQLNNTVSRIKIIDELREILVACYSEKNRVSLMADTVSKLNEDGRLFTLDSLMKSYSYLSQRYSYAIVSSYERLGGIIEEFIVTSNLKPTCNMDSLIMACATRLGIYCGDISQIVNAHAKRVAYYFNYQILKNKNVQDMQVSSVVRRNSTIEERGVGYLNAYKKFLSIRQAITDARARYALRVLELNKKAQESSWSWVNFLINIATIALLGYAFTKVEWQLKSLTDVIKDFYQKHLESKFIEAKIVPMVKWFRGLVDDTIISLMERTIPLVEEVHNVLGFISNLLKYIKKRTSYLAVEEGGWVFDESFPISRNNSFMVSQPLEHTKAVRYARVLVKLLNKLTKSLSGIPFSSVGSMLRGTFSSVIDAIGYVVGLKIFKKKVLSIIKNVMEYLTGGKMSFDVDTTSSDLSSAKKTVSGFYKVFSTYLPIKDIIYVLERLANIRTMSTVNGSVPFSYGDKKLGGGKLEKIATNYIIDKVSSSLSSSDTALYIGYLSKFSKINIDGIVNLVGHYVDRVKGGGARDMFNLIIKKHIDAGENSVYSEIEGYNQYVELPFNKEESKMDMLKNVTLKDTYVFMKANSNIKELEKMFNEGNEREFRDGKYILKRRGNGYNVLVEEKEGSIVSTKMVGRVKTKEEFFLISRRTNMLKKENIIVDWADTQTIESMRLKRSQAQKIVNKVGKERVEKVVDMSKKVDEKAEGFFGKSYQKFKDVRRKVGRGVVKVLDAKEKIPAIGATVLEFITDGEPLTDADRKDL